MQLRVHLASVDRSWPNAPLHFDVNASCRDERSTRAKGFEHRQPEAGQRDWSLSSLSRDVYGALESLLCPPKTMRNKRPKEEKKGKTRGRRTTRPYPRAVAKSTMDISQRRCLARGRTCKRHVLSVCLCRRGNMTKQRGTPRGEGTPALARARLPAVSLRVACVPVRA